MDQGDWRFCGKCSVMFFDGDPNRKGACPADGLNHAASGFMFVLPHDVPESPNAQGAWRFCNRCFAMFFDGAPDKGACDAGPGGHAAQGFVFVLPHDVPGSSTAQTAWRFCGKCFGMFFDGSENKGHCGGTGGHVAAGFMFVLPHLDDEVLTFDSGPITSNLPLGGSAHLVVNRTGTFTFSTHAHDSGFDNIGYSLAAVLMSSQGVAFSFTRQGGVEGRPAARPGALRTSRRRARTLPSRATSTRFAVPCLWEPSRAQTSWSVDWRGSSTRPWMTRPSNWALLWRLRSSRLCHSTAGPTGDRPNPGNFRPKSGLDRFRSGGGRVR